MPSHSVGDFFSDPVLHVTEDDAKYKPGLSASNFENQQEPTRSTESVVCNHATTAAVTAAQQLLLQCSEPWRHALGAVLHVIRETLSEKYIPLYSHNYRYAHLGAT